MGELKHIGVIRRSGRYPWGSGKNGYQRNSSLRGYVLKLKKQGLTEKEIAEGMGIKTTRLRAEISMEKSAQRQADAALAQRLKDKGYSYVEIGKRMGKNESSVRSLLDPVMQERAKMLDNTVDMLKRQVDEKVYLDVGLGIENQVGVTRTMLNTAVAALQNEGYKAQYVQVPQPGTGKMTSIKVLTKGDVDYTTLALNKDKIKGITEWSEDKGRSYLGLEPITNISKDRISVKFVEDGGGDMDGVIQLRRGVADISLGESKYAQVRIGVEGTHFLKGMAVYSDDLPDGVDILFNTSKSKDTPILGPSKNTVLKSVKDDPDNPFGSTVRQMHYKDANGNDKLSAINKVYEEGDWDTWSKTLSSQMLGKQSPALAKQQLDLALKIKQEEFDDYNSLTNPTVKKKLLANFADECDSDAVNLKAAAMPRQASYVILPSTDLKPNEIYAPNYKNGETVVLIRHPHGGTFEIPQLQVNNTNPKAKSIFGNAIDAVAIHPSAAKKLSGADFDGDTVLVIPNGNKLIKTTPSLKSLSDFDPKLAYPAVEGMKRLTPRNKQTEMGKISNLITDMTIKGASHDEIARAVRHSMVVIDAEKHELNYQQSFLDNGIASLKTIYQGGPTKGAATLLSRAKSEVRVDKRKDIYKPDPNTGKKIFEETGEKIYSIPDPVNKGKRIYINYPNKDTKRVDPKTGKKIFEPDFTKPYYIDKTTKQKVELDPNTNIKEAKKKTVSTKMYETDDANSLSSGTRMESIYAGYANSLKAMGDKARKISINTPPLEYSPSANKVYSKEVASLKSKLSIAISNKPKERQALLLANKVISSKRQANPDLDPQSLKKLKGQALAEARNRSGAKKITIQITPKEWEAIQSGAVSNSILSQMLNNTDPKVIKEYATPRSSKSSLLSPSKLGKAKIMFDRGYTQAEVASMLGVSATTLVKAIEEKGES